MGNRSGSTAGQNLSGRGKNIVNSLVKGLVQANDLEDLIHFNESKQKMILSRIKEKFGDLEISDDDLLKEVQEAVASQAERQAKRDAKKQELQAQLEKRDLEALKQKLASLRG